MGPSNTTGAKKGRSTPQDQDCRRETGQKRGAKIDLALGQIVSTPPGKDAPGVNAHPFPAPRDAVDAVVNFFEWNSILAVPGDFLKIGTFHGNGLCRAARHLCRRARGKRLTILDDCDLGLAAAPPGRSLSNVDMIFGDSRSADLGQGPLSFVWVGRHTSPFFDPGHDFALAWPRLSARGGLVFDLGPGQSAPAVARVEDILAACQTEIFGSYRHKGFGLRFVIKK